MTASGRIWTRGGSGWCLREPTKADLDRHAIIRRWLSGEITFKEAAAEIRTRGISEFECAP
ncbi:MAG: hypothetical protein KGL35_32450 [Bradyrhizobium sp.]|nr:hypothetical protein [Bradyrhizobium sp.]